MKKHQKKLIKALLISAAYSLVNTNAEAEIVKPELLDDDHKNSTVNQLVKTKTYHNVIKMGHSGNLYSVNDHRSHGSHRSHSSHQSSRSGHSSHYSSSHYSSSSSTSSRSSSGISGGTASLYSTPKKTFETYSLGDRTLKKGLYGSDVDELVNKLVNYKYLRTDGLKKQSGYYLFDSHVEEAVKYFQEDAVLATNGVFDANSNKVLSNWNPSKTQLRLGVRDLYVGCSGDDVGMLIQLLNEAKCPPNPNLFKKDNDKYVYTEDVATAVRVFQAFAGLTVTGRADLTTINKLKSSVK